MKKLSYIIAIMLCSNAFAQVDTDAMAILDKLSDKMQADKCWAIEFKYSIDNKKDETTYNESGTLFLKGDKYILEMLGNTLYYNGEKSFNYLHESNEVTIDYPQDGTEELFFTSPTNLFNFYKEGYKSKYSGEKKLNNQTLADIDLFPNELEKDYFRINLLILSADYTLKSLKVYYKNGVSHSIDLTSVTPSEKTDADFTFSAKKHPGVEVIDLTN